METVHIHTYTYEILEVDAVAYQVNMLPVVLAPLSVSVYVTVAALSALKLSLQL